MDASEAYRAPAAPVEIKPAAEAGLDGRPIYFSVSILKLTVMSLSTFGLYEVYWFYQQWKQVRDRNGWQIRPVWRAIFAILFCHQLFKQLRRTALSEEIQAFDAGALSGAWILLTLAGRLPDPWWVVSVASILPLIPVQRTINRINDKVAPEHDPNARFSVANIVVVLLAALTLVIAIMGPSPTER
jgi:hypothetical protein